MGADDQAELLLNSQADLLGDEVLRGGDDPSFSACAALLPELEAYTFLANEAASEVIYVEPDGRLGVAAGEADPARADHVLFDPRELLPPEARATRAVRRLVGGHLPAINYSFFDPPNGLAWQEIAFLRPSKPELCVYFRLVRSGGREGLVRLKIGPDGTTPVTAEWFASRLRELETHWEKALAYAMRADTPEP